MLTQQDIDERVKEALEHVINYKPPYELQTDLIIDEYENVVGIRTNYGG